MAVKRKASGKSSFLDKVLGRIGRIDPEGLQTVVQQLARERAFLETVFNSIADGVLVLDADGRILYANQAAPGLVGVPADGAEGLPIGRFLPGLDWDRLRQGDPGENRGVYRTELEVEYPRPRFLRVLATPLAGGRDGTDGVVLIVHDQTELRQQTSEVIESERLHALTLLAASVAHEIGNPLNAIHIHLQLLTREIKRLRLLCGTASADGRSGRPGGDTMGTDEVLELAGRMDGYLDVAQGEIGRLDYIITEFLQALRPTPPRFEAAVLNDVARATLDLLRPELDNRGLEVEDRLAPRLPAARCDPAQIKQVLVNLIKNAMQAMQRGGRLTLASGATPDAVWLSITDTGGGIPPEQLQRIFQPFYTTKEKGTGLGLMIVQRIIRDHGGRVEMDSRVHQGTTFRLWLPLMEPSPRLLGTGRPAPVRA